MTDERDRRRNPHRDHADGRTRSRTPQAVPVAVPHEVTPELAFDRDTRTPVEVVIERIASRGATITDDLRMAVEEIYEHIGSAERRGADRDLEVHATALRGAPPMSPVSRMVGVAKWLGPLLIAIAGALYAAGVRQGLSQSAADARAADRRQIEQLTGAVRRLELNVSNLRGLFRAPWVPIVTPGTDDNP